MHALNPPPTRRAVLTLRLLGGAALDRDGSPVRSKATQRRRLGLLALLAVTGRERLLGREKIIALLWPEHSEEAGRRLLSEALYVLRREIGDEAIVAAGDEMGLRAVGLRVDLWDLEEALATGSLASAVALYRGPLLDGFFVSGAPDFERWLDRERERLDRSYRSALERLAEAAAADGRPLVAAGWWQQLVVSDPASSRAVLRLMSTLQEAGEPYSAVRAASAHVDYMREEMGAEPDPQVARFAERLRAAPPASPAPALREGAPPDERVHAAESVPVVRDTIAATPARSSHRSRAWIAVVLAGVSVLTAAGVAFTRVRSGAPPLAEIALEPRRVAVLYLDDHSEGMQLGHIAKGLTEQLIHELAQMQSIQVVSRNGVKPFRDTDLTLDSIARVLHAGSIVDGSVQVSHGRIRVTVQLVDARTGTSLESRTLERPVGELFALEDDLAGEVTSFLRRRLGMELQRHARIGGTSDWRARDFFLRGELRREDAAQAPASGRLGSEMARRQLGSADSLYQLAAAADPAWIDPVVARGWLHLQLARVESLPAHPAHFDEARRFAERALALRPRDVTALELRGTARWRAVFAATRLDSTVADSALRNAELDLRTALIGDPQLARAWSTLSQLLRLRGELPAAEFAAKRALREDEYLEEAPLIIERLYRSAFALGRDDEAREWCERGRREYPNDWRFAECRLTLLGREDAGAPDVTLAWRLYDELHQLDPPERARESGRTYSPLYRRMAVARVVARARLRDSALAIVRQVRIDANGDPELVLALAYDEAYVRLLLGDRNAALHRLREYIGGKPHLRQYLAGDIQFRRLWDEPAFQVLVAGATPR